MKKPFFTVTSLMLSATMVVCLSSCKGESASESEAQQMQPEQVEDYNDYVSDFEEAYSIEEMDEEYTDDVDFEQVETQVQKAVKHAEAEVEKAVNKAEAEVEEAIEEAEAQLQEAIDEIEF
jgi:hypothetical protein